MPIYIYNIYIYILVLHASEKFDKSQATLWLSLGISFSNRVKAFTVYPAFFKSSRRIDPQSPAAPVIPIFLYSCF